MQKWEEAMEHEILFRGKRIDNGEWVYGVPLFDWAPCSLKCKNQHKGELLTFFGWDDCYHEYDEFEINPATVGQYTGLTDKNGVKIFEGDIVSANNKFFRELYRFVVKFGLCGGTENVDFAVGYPCFFFEEITDTIPEEFIMRKDPLYFLNAYECKVIGNIYNNPELLNGSEV